MKTKWSSKLTSKAANLHAGVIDGKALPPIEIIPKNGWFDYANKYQANATEEVCLPISAKRLQSA